MKLRKGFVSNSSSSSFIIYGLMENDLPEDIQEKFDDYKVENSDLSDIIFGYDADIIGERIVSFYEDDYYKISPDTFTEKNYSSIRDRIKKIFKSKFDFDIPDGDFCLMGSVYYDG